jgi:mannose-6-phosphate isomerase-like protein (cupin superfamily)
MRIFCVSAFRLKILRKQMNLSLQDLADQTELTKSYLSKVERGLSVPSVAVALKLAKALHVEVDQLFDDAPADDAITVVRVGDRVPMGKPQAAGAGAGAGGAGEVAGSAYEVLAARAGHKRMLPFVIRPSKDFAVTEFKEHEGEEFLFVHRGRIEMEFATQKVELATGDSVYFNAQIPHRIRSVGAQVAEVLLIVASPEA